MLRLSDPDRYQAGLREMRQGCPSPKAMMSFRDADIVEAVLLSVAQRHSGPPRFLEWGTGLSTAYYTRRLARQGDFLWVTLEYDREFFENRVAAQLSLWSPVHVITVDGPDSLSADLPREGVVALVFDAGRLSPAERESDRAANLDDYVAAPARLGGSFDAILVDGRKRRRCLIEAARLVSDDGAVLLHDASRPYYHCAWSEYRQSRRVGDDLWIGAQGADLDLLLPPGAGDTTGEHDDLIARLRYVLDEYGQLPLENLVGNPWIAYGYQPDLVEQALAAMKENGIIRWDGSVAELSR